MNKKKSVTIVGGGLGGLVCGAILSKNNRHVRVLEKHSVIGGGLHTFFRDGVEFETGLHYAGGLEEGAVLNTLFTFLGIMDSLSLMPMDEDGFDRVHFLADKSVYPIAKGKEHFIETLSKSFPLEKENIRRYIDSLYKISDAVISENSLNVEAISVDELIASFTSDPRLQAVLAWNTILYGGQKGKTPAVVSALITKLFVEGATRFVSGGRQLADALCSVITSNGGEVLTNKEVSHIEIDSSEVKFITTSDGNIYQSDDYIFSPHPSHLIDISTSHSFTKAYSERIHSMENSYSMFTLFIKLKDNTFPFLNHNVFIYDDYDSVWNCAEYTDDDFPRVVMMMTPPVSNQGLWAKKMIIHSVMRFDSVEKWRNTKVGRRGEDYIEYKNECKKRVLDKLKNIYPQIDECIESIYTASPLTVRDFLGNNEGAVYGSVFDCNHSEQLQMSVRTKVNNLYLTGQNVRFHGICGVPMTSLVTCATMLGIKNYYKDTRYDTNY